MGNLIKNLVEAARRFTGADFAVFKICLLSIGILLGSYFSYFFLQYTLIVWVVAVISGVYLINQLMNYYKRQKK